jgi:hypothetical protein
MRFHLEEGNFTGNGQESAELGASVDDQDMALISLEVPPAAGR